jgi:hypothetical protein
MRDTGCIASGVHNYYSSYNNGNWRLGGQVQSAPRNIHFKFRITNLLTGNAFDSPWVLIDWSKVP